MSHVLATLAELVLDDQAARNEVGRSTARDILTWHALEVGSGEFMRIFVMCLTDLLFIFETGVMGMISIPKDWDARRHPVMLARSFAWLPRSSFVSMKALRILAQYHRRGFHPNDRDTTQLIAQWREALFCQAGELTDVLAR